MATNEDHRLGVYVKGDAVRIAHTKADAVALVFDGYKFQGDEPGEDGPTYRSLQDQAKALGVTASGSYEDLAARVTKAQSDSDA